MTLGSPRDASADRGDFAQAHPFLATHRGHAAFVREYARLVAALVAEVADAARQRPEFAPVIRQSPERCIVQLGPVALTIVWLRKDAEGSSNGELLLILWRGTIAKAVREPSAYPVRRQAVVPPTILWEETLFASTISESNWAWKNGDAGDEGVNSLVLAERSVRRLAALHDDETALPVDSLTR